MHSLVALSLIIINQLWEPGATGYTFVKLGIGVRPVAMGNAFTAISDDGNAVFWNPSGLGIVGSYYATGMAMNHLDYWEYYNLTSAVPLGKGLVLTLQSEAAYKGRLRFDGPRCVYPTGSLDWARLNEMPAWFVVQPAEEYVVGLDGDTEKTVLGRELIDGVSVTVEPGEVRIIRVRRGDAVSRRLGDPFEFGDLNAVQAGCE